MRGFVVSLYIAPEAGYPMKDTMRVNAIKGVGLEGDRYAVDKGAFSKSGRKVIRQVTLIELEAVEKSFKKAGIAFKAIETRRNIIVRNFSLNNLVGRQFMIGNVRMKGIELCEPCSRPSKLCGKKGFEKALAGFGGLRAEILDSGQISVGDTCIRLNEFVAST